jgi:beta-glucosidase
MSKAGAMRWPDEFMWGTASSSTQCEGASPASDWLAWERAGQAPPSGDGNGFADRYAEDFALLAGLGLRQHRLSVDWARLEPARGVHDPAAIDHYQDVLAAARDARIVPWVCLHHFTLPQWFADDGGFMVESNRIDAWARHVEFVADTFGALVGGWQPINEPNIYAQLAYRDGFAPPGRGTVADAAAADEAIHLANAEAAVRLRGTAPVVSIFALSPSVLLDDRPDSRVRGERLYDSSWRPGIELFRDGMLRVRGRPPVERPDLSGAFDMIGFSYYAATGVRAGHVVIHPSDAPRSPLGYGIWADGVGLVLDRLHAELPDTPLLVAEFGIGTDDDDQRTAYLTRGLEVVHDALDRGVDVRGLFHWTGVDNYEWLHGFDVPFGIIDRDRQVKGSANVLATATRSVPHGPGGAATSDG